MTAPEDLDNNSWKRNKYTILKVRLTETLWPFPTPVARALTGKDSGQRELIALVTGVADARAPLEVSSYHLAIRNTGWCSTYNCCKEHNKIN